MITEVLIPWPPKHNLFGVGVTAATCDEACDALMIAARRRTSAVASAFSVHALMEAARAPQLADKVNRFDVIVPDGQPVRWALNWLGSAGLKSNVRGADLMWRLCERAAAEGVSIYLYGSQPQTIERLTANLKAAFPKLEIAGAESPPFRPLSPEEDAAMIERVNASGAGLMFLGLGCPKQDYFAAAHVDKIRAVQLCVGAAFDFHAGVSSTAPAWMQRRGLEWVYRLIQEPRRLWKRYLVTNTLFLANLAAQMTRRHVFRRPAPALATSSQNSNQNTVSSTT